MPENQSLRQSAVGIREKTNEKDENKDEDERLPRFWSLDQVWRVSSFWTLDVL